MKQSARITLGLLSAIVFWSAEAVAYTRYWVDFTIPVKDVAGSQGWLSFRNANDNNQIWIPQFLSNCDLHLIHAANERKDHCNNTIQVKITGMAYWANGAMGIDQYVGCGIVNDSWENKCVVTETTSVAATAAATTAATTTTTTASTETTVTASEQSATIVVNE